MDFKQKVESILKESNYNISDEVSSGYSFENVVDYYVDLTKDGYDHELIDEIQMHKFHKLDIKFVFEKRVDNMKKYKNRYRRRM